MSSKTKKFNSKDSKFWKLALGAIGVVYGDIGTSPLYTIKSVFGNPTVLPVEDNIYGVASLIFWALMLIVCVKYIIIIMRADNKGEGGILALVALVRMRNKQSAFFISLLGVFGAALLFGDGAITPAISVLGALEGLEVLSPSLSYIVVPLSVILVFGLFAIQSRGTTKIGQLFGPVIIMWFISIAIFGLPAIITQPKILMAINPYYAMKILQKSGMDSLHIIGSIVLAVTGVEALYADIGHFNKKVIRLSWFVIGPVII